MLRFRDELMYDRPTNSLWNQLTGEPVSGRLVESGIRLLRLPIVVTTWAEWKREHPDSLVLDPGKPGFDVFWFGWYSFFPTTEIYGR